MIDTGRPGPAATDHNRKESPMGTITTQDGTEIFYKDWGSGQPIVFSHGWPLSADDWDARHRPAGCKAAAARFWPSAMAGRR